MIKINGVPDLSEWIHPGGCQYKSLGQGPIIMIYAFFSDPSHGWLKVPVEEIDQLAISHLITGCSYISADRKFVYLEEDQDAQTFFNAILAAKWFADSNAIRDSCKLFHSDYPSFIRNLVSYDEKFVKKTLPIQPKKPEPAQPKIFDF